MSECLLTIRMAWFETCFCPLPWTPNVASHLDRSLRSVPAVRRRDHALSLPLPALPPGVLCLVLLPVVELCHMIGQFNMDHVASHWCTLHFYKFNSMLSARLTVLEFNDTHFFYTVCLLNICPLLHLALRNTHMFQHLREKLLELFKDGRLCSELYG